MHSLWNNLKEFYYGEATLWLLFLIAFVLGFEKELAATLAGICALAAIGSALLDFRNRKRWPMQIERRAGGFIILALMLMLLVTSRFWDKLSEVQNAAKEATASAAEAQSAAEDAQSAAEEAQNTADEAQSAAQLGRF